MARVGADGYGVRARAHSPDKLVTIFIYVYIHICTYVCVFIHIYICVRMYIYIFVNSN